MSYICYFDQMEIFMNGLILFLLFMGFLAIGVPVAFAISLSGLGVVLIQGLPIAVFVQRMYTGLDSFPLMAIPLFMLAGTLMGHGGITARVIDLALAFLGNIRGSLAHVVTVSGIALGSISGSGVANIVALGSILLPEMEKRNYNKDFSASLVASAGLNGLIMPPSIALIVFGVTAQVSIGNLFIAAILPAALIGIGMIIYCYFYAIKHNLPKEGKVPWKKRLVKLRKSFFALLMPVLLIGGIYSGIFTPTEAGAVVSLYAFIIGIFVYKEIKFKDIPKICLEAALNTAMIALIIAGTSLFGWILTVEQVPQLISNNLLSLTDNRVALLIIINLLMLIIGMFLDSSPKIMIFTPIFAPVAASLGMNLVQFGVIVVMNAAISLLTPPVGTGLFVASAVSGVPIGKLLKSMMPFFMIMLSVMLIITFVPFLTLWAF